MSPAADELCTAILREARAIAASSGASAVASDAVGREPSRRHELQGASSVTSRPSTLLAFLVERRTNQR